MTAGFCAPSRLAATSTRCWKRCRRRRSALFSERPARRSCSAKPCQSGTASSAAPDGVGARTSAARSASVTSVSWPIPAMTGTGQAATARTSAFFIERPEVLQRTAAARQDDDVDSGVLRCRVERGNEFARRFVALNSTRNDAYRYRRKAARQHMQDVADCSTARGGDDANSPRQGRRLAPSGRVEQALGGQPRAQLLEFFLQRTAARHLQALDNQLVVAARLVQTDSAEADHLVAVVGPEVQPALALAEEGAAQLGAGVLEAEVDVSGCWSGEVGDLPDDGDETDLGLQRRACQPVGVTDRDRAVNARRARLSHAGSIDRDGVGRLPAQHRGARMRGLLPHLSPGRHHPCGSPAKR